MKLNDVVSNIDYVSKQDFYDNTFTKQYPNGEFQGRTLTADDMQDSLWLKLKDPTKYQVVSEVLSGKEGVEDVTDQRQIFDPVFAVLNRATAVTAVLAGVMVVVAILLTGTTIRMSAASRRTETEIMRYVGASELDDSSAVHSGGRHRLADRLGALVPDAFGYRSTCSSPAGWRNPLHGFLM